MRVRRSSLAALTIGLLAVACGGGDDRDGGATGGTIIIATPGSVTPTLPLFAMTATTVNVMTQVYDRLAQISPELKTFGDEGFTPRLARSWTWAPDSMAIAFAIDPDARWHDGRPVRASDVRFSLEVTKDPAVGAAVAPLLANVDSISVRDSLTAVAWFRTRSPEQFYDLAYQLYIMPEHLLRDIPRAELSTADVSKLLVGTGRFRFARLEPGVRLELIADTANFRGRAKLDRVIFASATDGSAAVTQVMSGQADIYEFIPPRLVPQLDSTSPARAVRFPGNAYTFLGMNFRGPRGGPHPVFSDRAVRRAVSMALDRQGMLRNVFDTLGILGVGPFARTTGDTTVVLPPFDRARANALLDSAGWRRGADGVRVRSGRPLAFSILYPTSSSVRERYGVLIQEQLKSIGARVELTGTDFPTYMARQTEGNFDASLITVNPDVNLGGIRQYWTTSGMAAGGQNHVRYSNPRVDTLLDSAVASFDLERRNALAHEAFQTIVDDAPAVWLYDALTMNAMHRRIRPTDMRADGWWGALADWTIPADQRIERDRIGLRPAQP